MPSTPRRSAQATPVTGGVALPIAPDPTPTSAGEEAAVARVAASPSLTALHARMTQRSAPSPALLTAALAWVCAHADQMRFDDVDQSAPWMTALEGTLGGTTWTVTMNAWHALASTGRRVRTPDALRRALRPWGQDAAGAADLSPYVDAAVRNPNRAWAEHLLLVAPQWTGPQVRRLAERTDVWRLWRTMDRNTRIPPAGWQAIEQHLAFRPTAKEEHDAWALTLALAALWKRVGASPTTRARAVAILQRATPKQQHVYDLPFAGSLQDLVRGAYLPWADCAPWAGATTARGVIDLLLTHPHVPAAVAMQWIGDGKDVAILRLVAGHATLGREPAIRTKLWPFIRHSTAIMAVFLRHGTVEEAVAAFDVLAARAPRKALAAIMQDRPPAGFATSSATLQRLLTHREAVVRVAAIRAMHALDVDDTAGRTPLPKHQRAAVRRPQR